MDALDQKHDTVCRRIRWFRNRKELTLFACAKRITKAGYPLTAEKLSRIEKGAIPLKCWGFIVAFCRAVVVTPNEIMGLKEHR